MPDNIHDVIDDARAIPANDKWPPLQQKEPQSHFSDTFSTTQPITLNYKISLASLG
jgi:hypothetical protein